MNDTTRSTDTARPVMAAHVETGVTRSIRTRIKICGLRRPEDVDAAVEQGADAIGLVFYDKSPRFVSLKLAAELAKRLPPFVTPVGLFVDAAPDFIRAATDLIPNLLLQFHGDETPEQCAVPGRPYLRAARITPGFDLVDFAASYPDAQAVLLDAHVEGYGGGGKVFDWSLVARKCVGVPLVLSGGLHAANVIDGIRQLRPWAVDVSSGVESSRGIKSPEFIRQFCAAVRQADSESGVR